MRSGRWEDLNLGLTANIRQKEGTGNGGFDALTGFRGRGILELDRDQIQLQVVNPGSNLNQMSFNLLGLAPAISWTEILSGPKT